MTFGGSQKAGVAGPAGFLLGGPLGFIARHDHALAGDGGRLGQRFRPRRGLDAEARQPGERVRDGGGDLRFHLRREGFRRNLQLGGLNADQEQMPGAFPRSSAVASTSWNPV